MVLALMSNLDFKHVMQDVGLKSLDVDSAIKSMRGNRKVDSNRSDENYDALNKYGIDLVEKAMAVRARR